MAFLPYKYTAALSYALAAVMSSEKRPGKTAVQVVSGRLRLSGQSATEARHWQAPSTGCWARHSGLVFVTVLAPPD
jgi:hypothetical protein